MKFKTLLMAMAIGGSLLACGEASNERKGANELDELIGKASPVIENGVMTPEVLYSFGRVGNLSVSPDRSRIVYQVTYVSIPYNRTNSELFVMNSDGSDKKQLTASNFRESQPRWIENGGRIVFLSNESGSSQLWSMKSDGSDKRQLSDVEGGMDGFIFSPDETKLLFVKEVKTVQTAPDRYADLPEASGRIVDDLMYKHWDHWVESVPHPFVADLSDGKLVNVRDIMEGEPYESPMVPFGGIEQLAWSPDGKTIAYTSRKKTGKEYAESTNSDIYFYDLESGETRNMTEGMMGYDVNPSFSPDGTKLAWLSMERDGYEADKNRLFVMELATGQKSYVTESFDYNAEAIAWGDDNRTLYMVSSYQGTNRLFSVDAVNRDIKEIASGKHDYLSVDHLPRSTGWIWFRVR